MMETKEPVPQRLIYDLEEGKRRFPQVREAIINGLAKVGITEHRPVEQGPRLETEQKAWEYLVGQLENAMVSVFMRKPFDIPDLVEIDFSQNIDGASFVVEPENPDPIIYLDRRLINDLHSNYALLLENKAHPDSKFFIRNTEKLAQKIAELVIVLTHHHLPHELLHAHDHVHNVMQSLRSAFATANLPTDLPGYAGDPGEIEAQEMALDILEESKEYLWGEPEVTNAIDDQVYPYIIKLKEEIAKRKEVQKLLEDEKRHSA